MCTCWVSSSAVRVQLFIAIHPLLASTDPLLPQSRLNAPPFKSFWVKAVSGWDVWSARGAISIAQELKDFYCVACVLFFLSALSPPSFRFVLWDFFLCFGLPPSEIGFLLCFRTPCRRRRFCRRPPSPPSRRASALSTQTRRSLFEDNIIQNTSRFPSFLCSGIINIASNISSPPAREGERGGGRTCHTFARKHFHALDIELLPGVGSYWRCRSDGRRWKILKSEKLREFLKVHAINLPCLASRSRSPTAYGTFNIIIYFSNHQTLSYETTFYASWSEAEAIVERGGTMKMTDRAP